MTKYLIMKSIVNGKKISTILYAENDMLHANTLKMALEMNGEFSVSCAYDGDQAWRLFKEKSFDLCLLDVHMPRLSGVELAEMIRSEDNRVPIIYISADFNLETKIKGLGRGADDYCEKPIEIEVLIPQMRALIKRAKEQRAACELITFAEYTYNRRTYTISYNGRSFNLGINEVKILDVFTDRFNDTIAKAELIEIIGGEGSKSSPNTTISNLRKHFKDSTDVRLDTIKGSGYSLTVNRHLIRYH